MAEAVFYIFAAVAVISAVCCVLQRHPITAAMWLVATMFSLAGIYVLLDAQFIAAIQVLVYAGAIMVLFLFVIMLLNLGPESSSDLRGPSSIAAALVVVGLLSVELIGLWAYSPDRLAAEIMHSSVPVDPALALPAGQIAEAQVAARGVVGAVAEPLFTTYLVPFEITSILLLAALVGAVVLAKRRI